MNQRGFSQLILMVIVGVVIAMAGGSVLYYKQSAEPNNKSAPGTQAVPESSSGERPSVPTEQTKTTIAQKLVAHEMPKLLDIEVKSGVDKEDGEKVLEGFKAMDFYLNEWFGKSITKKSAIRVEATSGESKLLEEGGRFVFLWRTLSRDWQVPKQHGEQMNRVAAHEYVHLYQINNGCAHALRMGEKPKWFIEGEADWFSYKAVKGSWSFPSWFKFAIKQMGIKSIQTYDEAQNAEGMYPYFALAVDFLMKNRDIKTLDSFCVNLGKGQEVSVAFQDAFGTPLEKFYEEFEAYATKTFSIPVGKGEIPPSGGAPPSEVGGQSQIPLEYSSWADFCKAQPQDSRCAAKQPPQSSGVVAKQQLTGIPASDPEAGSVYIYISDQAEGCQDNCGAHPLTSIGSRALPDSRIIRIDDMTGKNWVSLGTYGKGINQFRNPNHLTVGPDGKLYVVDSTNDRIVRIDDMTGKGWTTYGISGRTGEPNTSSQVNLPSGEGRLAQPASIKFDSKGRIYIISGGELARIDDMTGKGWTTFGSVGSGMNQFQQGKGLAIDSMDRIYIVDAYNHRIIRIDDMTGKGWTTYGTKGSGVGQFEGELNGLSFDAQERIYISDEHNHRIVRIDDMTGKGWVEFGSFGNGVGQFDQPHDIWVMKNGHIYILDTPNGRVVRIDDMTGKGWIAFAPYANQSHNWTMQAPHGMFVVERK